MKNYKVKYSFIVPIYNSSLYLSECINSILNQDYNNYEIILINDGSTDDSIDICNEYRKKYKNIKLINQKNSGVSIARNNGIQNSNGEYILFVDSDDTIEKNYLSMIEKNIMDDLTCFGYTLFSKKGKITCVLNETLNNNQIISDILTSNNIGGYLWNKVFKSTIIKENDLYFEKNIAYCEDLLFVYNYLKCCNSFKYINKSLYNYRLRKSSVSSNFFNKKNSSILTVYKYIIKDNYYTNIIDYLKYSYLRSYYQLQGYVEKDDDFVKEILNDEKDVVSKQNFKEILKYNLIKKHLKIYKRILKLKINNTKNYYS